MTEKQPRARVIAIHQGGKAGAPTRNDRFIGVLQVIHSAGKLDQLILTPPITTMDEAEDTRRALYAAARYYCSCGQKYCTRAHNNIDGCPRDGMRLSCQAHVVKDPEGRLRVQFRIFDKKEAMREVVKRYGPDPSKWPYQSKARKIKEESA